MNNPNIVKVATQMYASVISDSVHIKIDERRISSGVTKMLDIVDI